MSTIRKLTIVVSHADIVNVISELMYLSCFEPTDPDITLDPPDLMDIFKREKIELENYSANMDNITVLASQYTYTLIGWVPAQHEPEIVSVLSGFTCSYDFNNPSSQDEDKVPTLLKFPKMLSKMRSGGQRIFTPLTKSNQL
jgi:vacuolar-type H+-ATPase subunit I/STV1